MLQPLHPKVRVPAYVGLTFTVVLALAGVVGGLVPTAAALTAATITVVGAIAGYCSYSKLKVPAVVNTVLTFGLVVLSAVATGLPEAVPIVAAITTVIHAAAGQLTFEETR